jgi:hypothetical protein
MFDEFLSHRAIINGEIPRCHTESSVPTHHLSFISGWWFQPTPLKNMSSPVGSIIPNIWKNKKCSKPPTSHLYPFNYTLITINAQAPI